MGKLQILKTSFFFLSKNKISLSTKQHFLLSKLCLKIWGEHSTNHDLKSLRRNFVCIAFLCNCFPKHCFPVWLINNIKSVGYQEYNIVQQKEV